MFKQSLLVLSVIVVLLLGNVSANSGGRGFGDEINWINDLEEARATAKAEDKPMMIILHKTWCGACKRLKPEFASSQKIKELSSKFVMVNLEDDEHPAGDEFAADGSYIPRIFFAGSDGVVDHSVYNQGGNPQYKYFYSNAATCERGMQDAATKFGV